VLLLPSIGYVQPILFDYLCQANMFGVGYKGIKKMKTKLTVQNKISETVIIRIIIYEQYLNILFIFNKKQLLFMVVL